MKHKLTTSEAAALAADEYLGASNFGETVEPTHPPGPYSVKPWEADLWAIMDKNKNPIAYARSSKDAVRIAYCLNIVEESEKTDRVA